MAETAGLGTTMFSGHKHTNRSLPINNKICNQRWVDRCQQLHRMRLNQIKPAIGAAAKPSHRSAPAPARGSAWRSEPTTVRATPLTQAVTTARR
jgi:hypothetical protein